MRAVDTPGIPILAKSPICHGFKRENSERVVDAPKAASHLDGLSGAITAYRVHCANIAIRTRLKKVFAAVPSI